MDEIRVSTFTDYHAVVTRHRPQRGWLFRGHASAGWKLVPKCGRSPYTKVGERLLLDSWNRWSVQYLQVPPKSDWEALIIAQHHGLATRLLDWTRNPLNAAYFALREAHEEDAVVYAALSSRTRSIAELPKDPFSFTEVAVILPPAVVSRIVRQHGLFTVHPVPQTPLESGQGDIAELARIVIDRAHRQEFMSDLVTYGVHSANLFPDLDGLAAFMNWCVETGEYLVPRRTRKKL